MKLTLTEQFYVNYSRDDTNTLATDLWNKIQREFHCCGVSGGLKSSWSWWLYQKSKWFEQQKGPDEFKNYVPESCCDVTLANLTECQRLQDSGGPVFIPAQRQPSMVTDPNPALYHKGCYDAVRESITENSAVIAAVILVTILITVICIALAACVCMEIRYDNYVV
ncbi:unnamed protein product [Lymnaea stagnalis]|uniref:Tetraspanin n=1 Tax=Lymnaea stagnalis TaxID=6523 RepID=A0AAV2IMC4_LYMST